MRLQPTFRISRSRSRSTLSGRHWGRPEDLDPLLPEALADGHHAVPVELEDVVVELDLPHPVLAHQVLHLGQHPLRHGAPLVAVEGLRPPAVDAAVGAAPEVVMVATGSLVFTLSV